MNRRSFMALSAAAVAATGFKGTETIHKVKLKDLHKYEGCFFCASTKKADLKVLVKLFNADKKKIQIQCLESNPEDSRKYPRPVKCLEIAGPDLSAAFGEREVIVFKKKKEAMEFMNDSRNIEDFLLSGEHSGHA